LSRTVRMRDSSRRTAIHYVGGLLAVAGSAVFVGPFLFVVLQALKTRQQAAELDFNLPDPFSGLENLFAVVQAQDFVLLRAFVFSGLLTAASVIGIVVCGSLIGFLLARKASRWNAPLNILVLAGLMIPPALVPTIYVMKGLGLYKTLPGLILIEIAIGLPFAILLFRAFVSSVPREIDEAAVIDGAGPLRMFFQLIFPLMRPVAITVVLTSGLGVYNDFVMPLYFLPGDDWPTVQLTLFYFQDAELGSQYNLLFMSVVLIALPPVVLFLFFNRQIIAGMASGAVK
jgi:ABC-type sugar transport system, permease component